MKARCPKCKTLFKVPSTVAQANRTGSDVRCSVCNHTFLLAYNIELSLDSLPTDAKNTGMHQVSPPLPSKQRLSTPRRAKATATASRPNIADDSNPDALNTQWMEEDIHRLSSGSASKKHHLVDQIIASSVRKKTPFIWWLLMVLLLFTLIAQGIYATRTQWLMVPELRPMLNMLCLNIGCTLPVLRVPEKIHILGQTTKSHPHLDDALLVHVVLSNTAAFEQPYPTLVLRLLDKTGALTSARILAPSEYLDDTHAHSMPIDKPVNIDITLVDPGSTVDTLNVQLR